MKAEEEIIKKTAYMYSSKTEEAWAALQKRIAAEETGPPQGRERSLTNGYRLWRVAVALIILAGLGWGIRQWIASRPHEVRTEWNQKTVTLPDGSVVFLNGHSRLVYPRHFSSSVRAVELTGEAFFQVAKEKQRPFVITASRARIRVVGTSFNVLAPPGGEKVEVLVKTGVVALSENAPQASPLLLHPNEFGVLKGHRVIRTEVPGANYLSWRTKVFRFRGEKLEKVLEVLNHAYATQIVLSSDSLGALRLTATYHQADLDTVLRSVCLTFGLSRRDTGQKIVLGPKSKK